MILLLLLLVVEKKSMHTFSSVCLVFMVAPQPVHWTLQMLLCPSPRVTEVIEAHLDIMPQLSYKMAMRWHESLQSANRYFDPTLYPKMIS